MKVKITKSTFNGIEFLPEPRVLNLGGVGMMGVQTLEFELPTEWKSLTVTLHIEREGGDRSEPIVLDKYGSVNVDKRFTAARQGAWMLLTTNGTTYTAMTKPAPYRCYKTIDTTPAGADVSPTLYGQLIAQVAACRDKTAEYAAQAKDHRDAAEQAVTNAEAAAARAENASLSLQGDASNLMIYPLQAPLRPGLPDSGRRESEIPRHQGVFFWVGQHRSGLADPLGGFPEESDADHGQVYCIDRRGEDRAECRLEEIRRRNELL